MKKYAFFLVLMTLSYVSDASKKKIDTHSNVLLLDSENFEQALKEYKYLLVDFYVPYCKKCSTVLRSEWGATAMELQGNVRLGKVNINKGNNYKLAKRFELCEYPSFRFFKNGKVSDYDGGFTKRKILTWLKKKTATSQALTLKSKKEYNNFIKEVKISNGKVPVIGYYSTKESDESKGFLEAADEGIMGVEFAITTDSSIFSNIKVEDGEIILHHTEIEDPIFLRAKGKKEEIKKAIEINKLPLLRDFVEYDMDMKMHTDAFEDHIFIATSFSSDKINPEKKFLRKLATEYKEKILFVLIDMDEHLDRYDNFLEFLDISEAPDVALASIKKNGVTKFKPKSNEISEKNIQDFLEKYTNGKLSPIKDEL